MTNLETNSPDEAENAYVLQSPSAAWDNLILNLSPVDDPPMIERLLPGIRRDSILEDTPRTVSKALSDCSMAVNAESTLRRDGLSPWLAGVHVPPSLISDVSTIDSSVLNSKTRSVLVDTGPLDAEGSLLVRHSELQCEFWYLACEKVFNFTELSVWHDHCRSHLGSKEPPKAVSCPISGCLWTAEQEHGEAAWSLRQEHITGHLLLEGVSALSWKSTVATTLRSHLWRYRIINNIQLTMLTYEGSGRDVRAIVQSHGLHSTVERSNRRRHHAHDDVERHRGR